MILGYSSNAFKKHSIFEAVEKIGRLGFRGIEIMCKRPHVHASDFGEEEWHRLEACIEAKNLKVINLNCSTLFEDIEGRDCPYRSSPCGWRPTWDAGTFRFRQGRLGRT